MVVMESGSRRAALKPWPCPNCGWRSTDRIQYGLPIGPLPDDVIHGGCVVGSADHGCRDCGHRWKGPTSQQMNDDWPKLWTWDLGDIGADGLLDLLETRAKTFDQRQEAIRRFMVMPAARPMPEMLIEELRREGYLQDPDARRRRP